MLMAASDMHGRLPPFTVFRPEVKTLQGGVFPYLGL